MTISEIRIYPTLFTDKNRDDCHESVLKSYQILVKVKEMLRRKDSQETIMEVIEICEESYPPTNKL